MSSRKNISGLACIVVCVFSGMVTAQPVQLTHDGRQKMDPVIIRGGSEIVFTVEEKFNQLSLMRLKIDDGSIERLHPEAATSEYGASFSADERYYAFMRNNGNLHTNLVIVETLTGNKVEYDPGGGFAAIREICMAPKGDRVLFAFPEKGFAQQVFSLNIDGQNKIALTESEGFDACPRFSPDGRRIAFASTRDGNFDIFVMNANGTQPRRLTDHEGLDTRPVWSPDGRQIAYTSLRVGNYDIYVMDADGTNERRVTDHAERDDYAWWHPDGKRLVVVCERNGHHDLYLVEVP